MGPLGKVALVGIAVSLAGAVGLGFWIPSVVERHLLEARAEIMAGLGSDLVAHGLVPVDEPGTAGYESLDEEVRLRLLGGETARVKLWSLNGTVVYSDEPSLVGQRFGLSDPARAAVTGELSFEISDLSDPAHSPDRVFGELIEFYVPVVDSSGGVLGLLEIEQRLDTLKTTLGHVRRNLWVSIGTGVGVLSVFIGSLAFASARIMNRRRRQTERILGSLLRVQDEERRRTVGALHDDIGQPLYRLLYGLQGSRSQLGAEHPASGELGNLEELARDIERTLRAELKLLHSGVPEDLPLVPALRELVDATRAETGQQIELRVELKQDPALEAVTKSALLRAAREGLINVRKHAEATSASVTVSADRTRVVVEVSDNGNGTRGSEGLGLATTRERLESIGGGLRVRGQRGTGTTFRAWVPLRLDEGES
jgi:signal transduction histidine kinase